MARIASLAIAILLATSVHVAAQEAPAPVAPPAAPATVPSGIEPKGDIYLGTRDASVLVEEYSSLTCQSCAQFHGKTFPEFREKYVDTGLVRYVLRPLPVDPISAGAFMLARCGFEDDFYPRIEHLFRTQGLWSRSDTPGIGLLAALQRFGFDESRYETCLSDQSTLAWIVASQDKATNEVGVKTSPTFVIDGELHEGALDIEQLAAIIDPLLEPQEP